MSAFKNLKEKKMAMIGGWRAKYFRDNSQAQKKLKGYQRRDRTLEKLGYSSYQQYLKSEDWSVIRSKKLSKCPLCLLCGKAANQVHHMDYSIPVILGLKMFRLVALCDTCHEGIEWDGSRKRDVREATKDLVEKAVAAGQGSWLGWMDEQELNYKRGQRKNKKQRRSKGK
jgi:hypothetical protein